MKFYVGTNVYCLVIFAFVAMRLFLLMMLFNTIAALKKLVSKISLMEMSSVMEQNKIGESHVMENVHNSIVDTTQCPARINNNVSKKHSYAVVFHYAQSKFHSGFTYLLCVYCVLYLIDNDFAVTVISPSVQQMIRYIVEKTLVMKIVGNLTTPGF